MRRLNLLLLVAVAGCATRMPCPSEPLDGGPNPAPPLACRVDGCTLVPDFNFASCCNNHDVHYWSGGTEDARKDADRVLRQCIADRGHPGLAQIYYGGVRVMGTPLFPTPWRWGFGWPFFHGYDRAEQSH